MYKVENGGEEPEDHEIGDMVAEMAQQLYEARTAHQGKKRVAKLRESKKTEAKPTEAQEKPVAKKCFLDVKAKKQLEPMQPEDIPIKIEPSTDVAKLENKMLADWDFEKRSAFLNFRGTRIFSEDLKQMDPAKKDASRVAAIFSIEGANMECAIQGIWWELVKFRSSASASSSSLTKIPVIRLFGERKKIQER